MENSFDHRYFIDKPLPFPQNSYIHRYFLMRFPVHSVEDLALLLRAVRKSSRVRQDDLAATAGVSKQFASDVEHGKPTVQMGLVLKLLAEAGVSLTADIPDSAVEEVSRQRAKRNAKALGQDA